MYHTTSFCSTHYRTIARQKYPNRHYLLRFAKAFDPVDHQLLLQKLKSYGVRGKLYNWFANYLSGRCQRVVIDGTASNWAPVTSGVPQGSILGPVLFVIFINDLPYILPDEKMAALYADDTKVCNSIRSKADCEKVQQALTNLECWNRENNLDFNSSKCKVLTITRKKSPLIYAYQINFTVLSRVEKEKDLGVCVNKNLSWNDHICTILQKRTRCLDF